MGLKEVNGKFNGLKGDLYHRIKNVTGIEFGDNPCVHVRKEVFSSREFCIDKPNEPLVIETESFPITQVQAAKIKEFLYKAIKVKTVKTGETIIPAVIDEESGEETEPETTEDILEQPYAGMEDILES